MKTYEALEAKRRFTPGVPVMVRLDGRSFSTFTKGMPRPFHAPMSRAMIETARYLVEQTPASFAYTQSDEISLGFCWTGDASQGPDGLSMLFNGRVQKLCSVLAAMATAKFNQQVALHMPSYADKLPVFDARAFELPNLEEMANCVRYRVLDGRKNAVTMAALARFGHKELLRKSTQDKLCMLRAVGVDWNDLPDFFRNGTFLRRETTSRLLTPEELQKIPPAKRPCGPVLRTRVSAVSNCAFEETADPVAFLFSSQLPPQ